MMQIAVSILPSRETRIDVDRHGHMIRLRGDLGGPSFAILIPGSDEEALIVLDLLEAAIDNARTAVQLRAQDYMPGAGESVEAYRG